MFSTRDHPGRFAFHRRAVNPLDDDDGGSAAADDDDDDGYVVARRRESVMAESRATIPAQSLSTSQKLRRKNVHPQKFADESRAVRRESDADDDVDDAASNQDYDDCANDDLDAIALGKSQQSRGVFSNSNAFASGALGSGAFDRRRSTRTALDGVIAAAVAEQSAAAQQAQSEPPLELPPCLFCLPPKRGAPSLEYDSLFIFSGTNPFRVFIHNVVRHRYFEAFIILIIFINCIFLMIQDPTADSEPEYQLVVDLTFASIYTAEMFAKQLAFGLLLHPHAYLRDRWNVLDFLIVLLTWVSFVPGVGNYSALRVLRVLRPLRSMNAVKGLKVLVTALIESFAALWPVLLIFGILITIFSIVGVQLFGGNFRYFCVSTADNATVHPDGYNCDPAKITAVDFNGALGTACPEGYACLSTGNAGYGFASFDNTLVGMLMVFEVVTFEGWPNQLRSAEQVAGTPTFIFFFFLVLLGSYIVPNLALAVINERYHDALEKHYRREWRDAQEAMEQQRLQEVSTLRLNTAARARRNVAAPLLDASMSGPIIPVVPGASDETMLADEAEEARAKFERLQKRRGSRRGSFMAEGSPEASSALHHAHDDGSPRDASMSMTRRRSFQVTGDADGEAPGGSPFSSPKASASRRLSTTHMSFMQLDDGSHGRNPFLQSGFHAENGTDAAPSSLPPNAKHAEAVSLGSPSDVTASPPQPPAASPTLAAVGDDAGDHADDKAFLGNSFSVVAFSFPTEHVGGGGGGDAQPAVPSDDSDNGAAAPVQSCPPPPVLEIGASTKLRNLVHVVTHGCDLPRFNRQQAAVDAIARRQQLISLGLYNDFTAKDDEEDPEAVAAAAFGDDDAAADAEDEEWVRDHTRFTPFAAFVTACVLLNTLVLASQHFQQPDWLDQLTSVSNIVFLCVFILELVLLFIADGARRFLTNGFYMFDAVIVILSIVELFLSGSNVITAFRCLRLLRVLKLLRNFPSLQSLVAVILDALQDTLYLTIVFMLLLLIFALIGMQFFGGVTRKNIEAAYPGTQVRTNFDTFLNAFYSVFIVITCDNWPTSMYQTMAATNPAAALFYVLLILVGTYFILNLFLSILIQGFEVEGEAAEQVDEEDEEYRRAIMELQREVVVHVGTAQYHQQVEVADVWAADTHLMITSVSAVDFAAPAMIFSVRRASEVSDDDLVPFGSAPSSPPTHGLEASAPLRRPSNQVRNPLAGLHGDDDPLGDTFLPREEAPLLHQQLSAAELKTAARVPEAIPAGKSSVDGAILSGAGVCSSCGSFIQAVLTSPPFEKRLSDKEQHDTTCWLAEQRVKRETGILKYLELVNDKVATDAVMSEALATAILEEAQSRRLFETLTAADLTSWEVVQSELREELQVARLAVGEEQLGRTLIAYVHAGTKLKHTTNGSTSLFIFGPDSAIRAGLTAVLEHPAFDPVMLTIIVLSCVILIIDSPRATLTPSEKEALRWGDVACSVIFGLEIVMRIVATGLVMHPGSFLRSGWHWLDLVSLVVSLAANASAAKSVRTLRFVRPLRTIKRYPGLRIVVDTILNSITSIVHVALLLGLNYLIFGILAVELFGGKLYSCNDAAMTTRAACTGTFNWTYADVHINGSVTPVTRPGTPRSWQPLTRNFDNIGTSFLALFQVSSGDNWSDILYSIVDANSYDVVPTRDFQPFAGLFLVAFYIVSNIFLLNLFVGVIIVNFSAVKTRVDGLSFLTAEQREWVATQRAMLNFRPSYLQLLPEDAAASSWRRHADGVLRAPTFEYSMAACITLNIVVIAMNYDGQSDAYALGLEIADAVFVGVYTAEMMAKLIVYRHRYFFLPWNVFDLLVTTLSLVEVVVSFVSGSFPVPIIIVRVMRFLRVLRILRLFKQARRLRVLIETLWFSLPSIANISMLIFIVYVVFAVIGMQTFADVKTGNRNLDAQFFNFATFFTTMQLLFTFTTLQNWSDAMYDVMIDTPGCGGADGSCGVPYAPLYFIAFIVICGFVMTNLFLAIILDNFEATIQMDQSSVTLSDLHRFTTTWAQYDPDATLVMPTKFLSNLLASLQPPLGTTRSDSRLQMLHRMTEYEIFDHQGVVHYAEVLVPLARRCAGISSGLASYDVSGSAFPETKAMPTVWFDGKPAHVGHTMAATYVAASYRRHLARRLVDAMRRAKRAKAPPVVEPVVVITAQDPAKDASCEDDAGARFLQEKVSPHRDLTASEVAELDDSCIDA